MHPAHNASSDATDLYAHSAADADLVTTHRDAILVTVELIEAALREILGLPWDSATPPVALARLLQVQSHFPRVDYAGLAELIDAYDMLAVIAQTPSLPAPSPEGMAMAKFAAFNARRQHSTKRAER